LRGHSGIFGITTVVRNADVEAGGDDRVADAEARVAARGDGSREVYAADAGVAANDAAGAGCRQRVLEINARVGDLDRHFARIQLRFLELDEAAFGGTSLFIDQKSFEGTHAGSVRWIG
jgi:hypothetical protein